MRPAQWLLAGLLALPLAGCGLFSSPEKQRAAAEAALAGGAYGEAAVQLRNLLDAQADDPGLRMLLARALFMQGDADGARRTLQVARERGAPASEAARIEAEWSLEQGEYQQVLDNTEDPQQPFTDAQRQYFRARALQGLLHVPEAITLYRELLAAQPQSADLQLRLAQSHAHLGRSELAQAMADKALASASDAGSTPVRARVWMLKGALAAAAREPQAVRQAYREAVRAAPGELTAHQQGQLLASAIDLALRDDDMATAREYLAQLSRVLPQSALARMTGAQIEVIEGTAANGIAELQRVLQDQPGQPAVRLLLIASQLHAGSMEQALAELNALAASGAETGQVQELIRSAAAEPVGSAQRALASSAALITLDQPAMARRSLERAVAVHPDDPELQRARVQVELRNGRTGTALELARTLVEQHPDDAIAQALLAEVQVGHGEHVDAATTYQALWDAHPSAPLALAYAQALRRAGQDHAEAPLRQWLERQPRDTAVRLSLATALQEAGSDRAATSELQRVLELLPRDHSMRAIALNNLAILQSTAGDARARETARAAYQIAPNLPAIQDTYGWLLVQAGRAEEGLPLLKAAADAMPASAEIRFHHAAALAAAGDKQAAAIHLADLLEHDGAFEGRAEAEQLQTSL